MPTPNRNAGPRPKSAGTTLVELTVCTAVVATVATSMAPSFVKTLDRHRLEALAAQLETDLQWTRSAAVARSSSVRITFEAGTGKGCYVIHTGPASACHCGISGPATCSSAGQALQVFRLPADSPLQLSANSRSMLFDANRGTVSPTGTISIRSSAGAIHQIVNIMGRVRSCSPAGGVPGLPLC